jgi:hypothetical protein
VLGAVHLKRFHLPVKPGEERHERENNDEVLLPRASGLSVAAICDLL